MLLCEQFGIRSFELGVVLASLQLRILIQFLQVQINSPIQIGEFPDFLIVVFVSCQLHLFTQSVNDRLKI